ncbi:hypothetical protein ACIPDW_18580 [Streptomyces sp. NPDC087290]|uniref:hypothetical protein n=1 Tax=Streptomyces sp. NPDC087290 TaxID=3365776 RepID=UPI0037FF8C0F
MRTRVLVGAHGVVELGGEQGRLSASGCALLLAGPAARCGAQVGSGVGAPLAALVQQSAEAAEPRVPLVAAAGEDGGGIRPVDGRQFVEVAGAQDGFLARGRAVVRGRRPRQQAADGSVFGQAQRAAAQVRVRAPTTGHRAPLPLLLNREKRVDPAEEHAPGLRVLIGSGQPRKVVPPLLQERGRRVREREGVRAGGTCGRRRQVRQAERASVHRVPDPSVAEGTQQRLRRPFGRVVARHTAGTPGTACVRDVEQPRPSGECQIVDLGHQP